MRFKRFHHPDFSLPVVARSTGQQILELLGEAIKLAATQGRSYVYGGTGPPREDAYYSAVRRLRKQGLVAEVIPGRYGTLRLTEAGRRRIPDYFRPERFWKRRWDKRWYMLLYDIPEKHRDYRRVLRLFLQRHRVGRLQKSVWITPDDLRPLYDDLKTAAGFRDYGIVFEARTVLLERTDQIVHEAWRMDRLFQYQSLFCKTCQENLDTLQNRHPPTAELLQLAQEELAAYASAMVEDPLLPNALLPPDYLGRDTYSLHRNWTRTVAGLL